VKVEMIQKATAGAGSDRGSGSTTTSPKDLLAIVCKVEIICSPVDRRVDGSEPGFTEDEIVVLERVEEGIKIIRVLVSGDRDRASVGRD
jgi:hypothetical protein